VETQGERQTKRSGGAGVCFSLEKKKKRNALEVTEKHEVQGIQNGTLTGKPGVAIHKGGKL